MNKCTPVKRPLTIYQFDYDLENPIYGLLQAEIMTHIHLNGSITQNIFDIAYSKVYTGTVECETLEEIFHNFNGDYLPRGYYYTDPKSMSVGDVFRFNNQLFLVTLFGFEELDISTDIIDQKAE